MGLDQYAYVAARAQEDHNDTQELAYWRKHPNLQGWMEQLWVSKGRPNDAGQTDWGSGFNGVELELTWDDVDQLEQDIRSEKIAKLGTVGFFFGNASDDHYRAQDLEFCKTAKAELFLGRKVFYNSSW